MSDLSNLINIYKKYFGEVAEVILEVGSRDGDDAYQLFNALRGIHVYTLEANPECYKIIQSSYPQFINILGAASNFTGSAMFNAVHSSNWNEVGTSSLKDRTDSWYDGKINKIIVNVDTMYNYIINNNIRLPIDIMKLDVEGCSYEVLDGFKKYLKNIKIIHLEAESRQFWVDQKLSSDIEKLLELNNFRRELQTTFGLHSFDEVWINASFI